MAICSDTVVSENTIKERKLEEASCEIYHSKKLESDRIDRLTPGYEATGRSETAPETWHCRTVES